MTPRLAIVAFAADRPLSPRGERSRAIASAAEQITETELIGPTTSGAVRRQARRLARLGSPWLLDAWEPEAWSELRHRRPRPEAGLLIGFPFSGVYWGARWLARERVRYVVDAGDPWVLTQVPDLRPRMGRRRAARCEQFIWRHAAGAILTTEWQADALRRLFPQLPVAVRPNGYRPLSSAAADHLRAPHSRTLRLVHYGNLYAPRLAIEPLLTRLAACGQWDSIVFTQQGQDWTGALSGLPSGVRVEFGQPCAWDQVVAAAPAHDLAVVVGNRNPGQLPSKAVQYLTLPIPRLAVVGSDPRDALRTYVEDKPGWLTLPWDAPGEIAGAAVAAHLAQPRSGAELTAPRTESWEAVAGTLVDFTLTHAAPRRSGGSAGQPRSRAMAAASSSQPR